MRKLNGITGKAIGRTGCILLLALSVCLAGGTAMAAGHKLREEVKKKHPISRETKLFVKNTKGKTIVVGREGLHEISILATKIVKAKDEESAAQLMKELTFDIESEGDEITVVTRYPRHSEERSIWSLFKGFRHRASIDYMIEVPRSFTARISMTSGDAEITSVGGDADVQGTSGDVRVSNVGGSSTLELTSGDIEVRDIEGDLRIQLSSGSALVDDVGGVLSVRATSGDMKAYNVGRDAKLKLTSGNLVLKGCRGDVTAVSASGDMVIKEVRGSVEVSSASGDIEVLILPVGEKRFNLTTCSGDVDVVYLTPPDYGFSLDVNTMSGSIEGDMEIKLERISRRRLKGVVGNGESTLVIETTSGDVSIRRGKIGW